MIQDIKTLDLSRTRIKEQVINEIINQYIPAFCLMKEEIERRYLDVLDAL